MNHPTQNKKTCQYLIASSASSASSASMEKPWEKQITQFFCASSASSASSADLSVEAT